LSFRSSTPHAEPNSNYPTARTYTSSYASHGSYYDNNEPIYAATQSGYSTPQSSYAAAQRSYVATQPSYIAAQSSYADVPSYSPYPPNSARLVRRHLPSVEVTLVFIFPTFSPPALVQFDQSYPPSVQQTQPSYNAAYLRYGYRTKTLSICFTSSLTLGESS
jgi:hypothetical protein